MSERILAGMALPALLLLASLVLAACASAPAARPQAALSERLPVFWADERFAEDTGAQMKGELALALSEDMEQFAQRSLVPMASRIGGPQALFSALFERGRVVVEYSSDYTRNASEAWSARRGNCLSLALMTAAYARRLGVEPHFHLVRTPNVWSRGERLNFLVRHVNVTLVGDGSDGSVLAAPGSQGLTVDFVPPNRRIREVVKEISEATVLAMYLNNLASEAMDGGRYDQSYQLVKQALLRDPALPEAYNTLGLVLQRRGATDKAEAALRQSLALAPEGVAALSNLLALLEQRGGAAAQAELPQLRERLAAVQPRAPFADFDAGEVALAQGDAEGALAAFLRQREVTGDDARIEQMLATSYARLGRFSEARDALRLALEYSDNEGQRHELSAKKKLLLQARAQQP